MFATAKKNEGRRYFEGKIPPCCLSESHTNSGRTVSCSGCGAACAAAAEAARDLAGLPRDSTRPDQHNVMEAGRC